MSLRQHSLGGGFIGWTMLTPVVASASGIGERRGEGFGVIIAFASTWLARAKTYTGNGAMGTVEIVCGR